MTTVTAEHKTAATEAEAAEATYLAAQAATDTARLSIIEKRAELAAVETEAAEAMAAVISGGGNRDAVDKARSRAEKLRSDIEWADTELQGAELALDRTADVAAHAHRAVSMQEWLAAHKIHNDPNTKINVLLAQLTNLVTELVPLVGARNQLHRHLEQQRWNMPPGERFQIPPGEPLAAPPSDASVDVPVLVPRGAIADAIEAGLAAAHR